MINRDDDERLSGKIVLTIPKRKGTVQFEETSYEIYFPAFLFCFSLRKGRINDTYVFALKGEKWNRNSRLYNYPFGNVSTSSHKVCWGRNQLPVIDSLHQLDMVCSLFLIVRQIMIIIQKVSQRNGNMIIFEAFWSV